MEDSKSENNPRQIDTWLGKYSDDHRHPLNIRIHWICVPIILWSVIALLWAIPVPAVLGRAGLWAAVAMFAALLFYQRLSRSLMFAMLIVFIGFGLFTELAYRLCGARIVVALAIAMFVVAWALQFIGHVVEGKRPSFATDLVYLLIGPAWLAAKLMRRFGWEV